MADRHFKRNAKVTLYKVRPPSHSVVGQFFDLLPNAVEITDLRIQFQVQRSLGSDPNTARVVVTNLASAGTAGEFADWPMHLFLSAGYDGEFRHICRGDLRWGKSEKVGTDWETTFHVADGDRAYRESRTNRTFEAGTSVRTALREVARTMGLKLPQALEVTPELEEQFAAGLVLDGRSRDELTNLLAPYGYEWSIQDNVLTVLKDDETRADQALVIAEETGLIGTPQFGAPDKPTKKGKFGKGKSPLQKLNLTTLLYPQVTPGCLLEVRSRTANGRFKAHRVTHSGDTYGSPWFTEIEARALNL